MFRILPFYNPRPPGDGRILFQIPLGTTGRGILKLRIPRAPKVGDFLKYRGMASLLNNVAARPRKSPFPMITVKDAQETVLKYCKNRPLDTETIDFMDSINRYKVCFL